MILKQIVFDLDECLRARTDSSNVASRALMICLVSNMVEAKREEASFEDLRVDLHQQLDHYLDRAFTAKNEGRVSA